MVNITRTVPFIRPNRFPKPVRSLEIFFFMNPDYYRDKICAFVFFAPTLRTLWLKNIILRFILLNIPVKL